MTKRTSWHFLFCHAAIVVLPKRDDKRKKTAFSKRRSNRKAICHGSMSARAVASDVNALRLLSWFRVFALDSWPRKKQQLEINHKCWPILTCWFVFWAVAELKFAAIRNLHGQSTIFPSQSSALEVCKLNTTKKKKKQIKKRSHFSFDSKLCDQFVWTNEVNNMLLFHMFFRSEPPSSPPSETRTMKLGWLLKECDPIMLMCSRETIEERERGWRLDLGEKDVSIKILSSVVLKPKWCLCQKNSLFQPFDSLKCARSPFQKPWDVDDEKFPKLRANFTQIWRSKKKNHLKSC